MIRLALTLFVLVTPAAVAGGEYDDLFRKHGAAQGVDWRLLRAIATVESHLNPRAENPDGLSAGIMQIYCAPARGTTCQNRFDLPSWPPSSREQLYDPDYNISIAAQILRWNIRAYGLHRGVAAYNQWSARATPHGHPFPNQQYVDGVMLIYRQIKATPAGGGQTPAAQAGSGPAAIPPR